MATLHPKRLLPNSIRTIRNMNWFEVVEVRGPLENNKVGHWQVTVKVGFTLDN